jgi:hypothetical protein
MRQRTANITSPPRAAPRRSATAVASKRPSAPARLSDEHFRDEDLLEAPPIELVDIEFPWDRVDLPDEVTEEVGLAASALRARSVPAHDLSEAETDEPTTGADNLVLRYLQEAGRVPLLTPAGEVDLAQQIEAAKAHVVAVLQGHTPSSPHGPVGEEAPYEVSDAWIADRRRQVQHWPSSTEAATRPNKEHQHSLEFPFLYLALAIYAENDRNEGCTMFKGREKVPVLVDRENLHRDEADDGKARRSFLTMR